MIRQLLGPIAVVAIVLAMTGAAPMAVAGAVPAAPSASNADQCGFLDDNGSFGNAASLLPKEHPAGGEFFYQEDIGAWQLCYRPDHHDQLTLYAYQGTWCLADDNANVELRSCNEDLAQQWIQSCDSNGCLYEPFRGGVLCAGGGVGAQDYVKSELGCSISHEYWGFSSIP